MLLITGGAGFLGSNLAATLERDSRDKIVICDYINIQKEKNLKKRNSRKIVHPKNLLHFLNKHKKEIDTILHLGAISSTTEENINLVAENNINLPIKIWDWCGKNNKRLIYASSAATYGNGSKGFDDDNSLRKISALVPLNLYGLSKHIFDLLVVSYLSKKNPKPRQWVGLKFFNVYGPNEYHKGSMKSVIAQIFPKAKIGKSIKLFKSHHPKYKHGFQKRDFIWVEDCVNIIIWFLNNKNINGIFNVGTGKARTFIDLVKNIFKNMDSKSQIKYIDTPKNIRKNYQYFTEAKVNKLRKAGYRKKFTTLEKGISLYIKDYLNSSNPFR